MHRRRFLRTSVTGALGLFAPVLRPAQAAAQSATVYRIGVLIGGIPSHGFREGLQVLGYNEGQNVHIIERSSEGQPQRFPDLVAQLLSLRVDVIVSAATPAVKAAKQATSSRLRADEVLE